MIVRYRGNPVGAVSVVSRVDSGPCRVAPEGEIYSSHEEAIGINSHLIHITDQSLTEETVLGLQRRRLTLTALQLQRHACQSFSHAHFTGL